MTAVTAGMGVTSPAWLHALLVTTAGLGAWLLLASTLAWLAGAGRQAGQLELAVGRHWLKTVETQLAWRLEHSKERQAGLLGFPVPPTPPAPHYLCCPGGAVVRCRAQASWLPGPDPAPGCPAHLAYSLTFNLDLLNKTTDGAGREGGQHSTGW